MEDSVEFIEEETLDEKFAHFSEGLLRIPLPDLLQTAARYINFLKEAVCVSGDPEVETDLELAINPTQALVAKMKRNRNG
jgi:hypothetical protein